MNHGDGIRIYEAVYGGSLESIGADRANPLPLILPAVEMLKDLGNAEAARRIRAACETVLMAGKVRTSDLGGNATTTQFTEAVISAMGSGEGC